MEAIETFQHAGKTISIYYDQDPVNPRKDYDHASIIAHWHRRYNLGEKRIGPCSVEEMQEADDTILAILPLYLFDHSGISVSTGDFGDRWDSGQIGWVYVTHASAEEMGMQHYSEEKLEEVIREEVKEYDHYLIGRCYYYTVEGRNGDFIHSCGGYLGDIKYCKEEAKRAAESSEDPFDAELAEELKNRTTYASVV